MILRRLTLISLISIMAIWDGRAEATEPPLDTSAVTSVIVSGAASSIKLTTAQADTLQANLTNRRTGWFARWYSGWFFNACPARGSMRIEGATLYIDVPPAGLLDPDDCVTEIRANFRPEVTVSVDQAAVELRLSGDYAAVTLVSQAADVALDGHAASVNLTGQAMRAHLGYQAIRQNETITITVKELDADLSFGPETRISYAVEAKAAWVDNRLANSPGAKPAISIKGDFIRATIR